MGLLNALADRKKVLTYEIIFGAKSDVGVRVQPLVPVVPGPDYIRLWVSYQAKIIYSLGFPKNNSAIICVGSVAKVVERDLDPGTDCFQRANFADVMRFAPQPPATGVKFTGEFYAKGSLERTIQTHFPLRASEQQVVYSGLALMQYAISMNQLDSEALRVLTATARYLVDLYQSGMGEGVASVVQIPTLAYMRAIGVQSNPSDGRMNPTQEPTLSGRVESRRNGFAITGLSLAIASVFLFEIVMIPILAVGFSGIGLAKVGACGGMGKVQAWFGLVLGILYTLVYMHRYGHL